ncbi:MAG: FadR/GntR family transcriptional regulator [Hyphomonadaceae bacterium]
MTAPAKAAAPRRARKTTPRGGGKNKRVFEDIYDSIRKDLAEGVLKPGDKLPAERDLAVQLGFSRSAVREALRALEASGIVHLQKGVTGGAYIRGGEDRGPIRRSLQDIVMLGAIPLSDVMAVRSLLVSQAVRLACRNMTDEALARIADNIARTKGAIEEGQSPIQPVGEFFHIIAEYCENEFLALLIDATTSMSLRFAEQFHADPPAELVGMRLAILDRLQARDGEGAAAAVANMFAFQHGFVSARATPAASTRRAQK